MEPLLFTMFYLVFPSAPDVSAIPDEVSLWQPAYVESIVREDMQLEWSDVVLHDPCETNPSYCGKEMSTLGSFLESPVAFLLGR